VLPVSYDGLANTDPFIFGEFFYTGCQQRTSRGPTQLRYLERGSVILFGSCMGERHFVLDTVFVVDDWLDHDRTNFTHILRSAVPAGYWEVTIAAWYQGAQESLRCARPAQSPESFRLYRGATADDPVEGMFSFFPCLPFDARSRGFERPIIEIPGLITGNLKQGKRLNPQSTLRCTAELWGRVVEQLRSRGLWLGVHTVMPERRARP